MAAVLHQDSYSQNIQNLSNIKVLLQTLFCEKRLSDARRNGSNAHVLDFIHRVDSLSPNVHFRRGKRNLLQTVAL
jgi:hypothetical protein